ncbi:nucleotide-binding domain containing protein [Mycobacterium sp. smrl_JER01]|uniref:nucleotide-binding domain containing protein n=1 Tax=Mycobacterium sp. smrl_JER01 TaxID=3402633 RepID=UPI003ACB81B4
MTSSDVATEGLGITRAWVRGTVLDGIVSLWEPADQPNQPVYTVFPGNVGDDTVLAEVVLRLESQ